MKSDAAALRYLVEKKNRRSCSAKRTAYSKGKNAITDCAEEILLC